MTTPRHETAPGPHAIRHHGADQSPGQDRRGGHGGHNLMMMLMCVPMLLIVGLLILSGSAGFGAIVYALACLGMMAAMMLFMQHGTRR